MIRQTVTPDGHTAFVTTNINDLHVINEWARAACHLAFGPEKGEAHYRKLSAKAVFSLWTEDVTAS